MRLKESLPFHYLVKCFPVKVDAALRQEFDDKIIIHKSGLVGRDTFHAHVGEFFVEALPQVCKRIRGFGNSKDAGDERQTGMVNSEVITPKLSDLSHAAIIGCSFEQFL